VSAWPGGTRCATLASGCFIVSSPGDHKPARAPESTTI
jgi:hypothetical protein